MAFPGNGTILATHNRRMRLFEKAASRIVEMANAWYNDGEDSTLPRSIATREAFLNAMAVDIAMGGSTNTVLHILAIAQAAEVDFTQKDIDNLSRKVPNLCRVAPSSAYHLEDVNRAGGIISIMGELDRAGLLDTNVKCVGSPTLADILEKNDIMRDTATKEAVDNCRSAPAGLPEKNLKMASQGTMYNELDRNRESGCIRDVKHCYSKDGGLAVLSGNIAVDGCIVKTAGVDSSILNFKGTARVYFSQESACEGILGGEVKAGDVVVIRYEGPKGGPGMQEMLYPTSYLKSAHLDEKCALITDGRFSGGTSGLSIGHVSPEAAAGGTIGLIEDGDTIQISIPDRTINLAVSKKELQTRRKKEMEKGNDAFKPVGRDRKVSDALKAYALFASSADTGAVRVLPEE
jgi:dihydroxy-acid dehydratase